MSAENAALLAALESLPEFDREVLHRRYTLCEAWIQIAAGMHTTTELIKQAHERALLVVANIES